MSEQQNAESIRMRKRRKSLRQLRHFKFVSRSGGVDLVADIAVAAELLRERHLDRMGDAYPDWEDVQGVGRIWWALLLDTIVQATGLSLDELIERVRARAALKEQP